MRAYVEARAQRTFLVSPTLHTVSRHRPLTLTACTLWGKAWCYRAVEPTDQMQPVRFDSDEELLQLSDAVCEGLLETGDFDECELWPL